MTITPSWPGSCSTRSTPSPPQIGALTARIEELIAAIPAAQGVDADGSTGPGAGDRPGRGRVPAPSPAWTRSPASALHTAQVILAEIGLDMTRFPTAGHLVSWAKLSPRTIQSGAQHRSGKTGKGNPYLKGVLGEAAAAAAKTDTFLGERYRRLVKRRGKLKALVAVARTILVIVWHLLADPAARFHDLGSGYYASRIDKDKKDPQPRPATRSARLHRHPRPGRLTADRSPHHRRGPRSPLRRRCRSPGWGG